MGSSFLDEEDVASIAMISLAGIAASMGSSFLDEEDIERPGREASHVGRASMGSSFLDEEDVRRAGLSRARPRGFNGVLVSRRGRRLPTQRPANVPPLLQWGPRFSTRKTTIDVVGTEGGMVASMGSSFLDEEDEFEAIDRVLLGMASMGSSFLDEEDDLRDEQRRVDDWASMGSSFLDEEDSPSRSDASILLRSLQWGPRFSTRKTCR